MKIEIKNMGWIFKGKIYNDMKIKRSYISYAKVNFFTHFLDTRRLWHVENFGAKPILIRSKILNYQKLLFGKMKSK